MKQQKLTILLKKYIKLLCELNQTETILSNIKKNPLYPMDECLKLCIEYGVNDATIYLYQTTGDRGKAFDITIRIFEDTFNKISSNLTSQKFNENIHTLLLQELQENLNDCIVICEHNEQQSEELWFKLASKPTGLNEVDRMEIRMAELRELQKKKQKIITY